MPFTAAPHHDVLLLLVQFAVLLLAARAAGEIAQRLGQPTVVGEILAGIVLGPSLLSGFFPLFGAWIVPESAVNGYLLEQVSLLGALFLLLITGLETDLGLIRQHARTAIGVSLGGITVTFATGFALGWNLPDDLLAATGAGPRLIFSLFVATAMSISAIPVIAKVLMDMNLMRRDVGQTIIAAGMSDDTIGWILLSIVAGLASGGGVSAGSVLHSVGAVALFLVLSFTVGRWLVRRAFEFVQDEVRSSDRLVTLIVVLMFAWGAITAALGLEAVLGAFVLGILFGQMPRVPQEVHHKLGTVGLAVFTPVFFAVAGLKVDARALLEPRLLLITLLVIAVASGGKILGTYLGARLIGGRGHWNALAFGAGLNARGAMEIIIATIGLELGILSQDMFSIIVVMAMVTSLLAPPALRWVLGHVQPERQELERLEREERDAGSAIAQVHRILLPVRRRPIGSPAHAVETRVLQRLSAHQDLSVTLLNVCGSGEHAEAEAFLHELAGLFDVDDVATKVVESRDLGETILREAKKDYDLLVLGAPEQTTSETLFHPLIDRLVRLSPCPSLVVRSGTVEDLPALRRILVPVSGSKASRAAAELAFRLAGETAEVVALHVLRPLGTRTHGQQRRRVVERRRSLAMEIVDEMHDMGEAQQVATMPLVRSGAEEADTIVAVAREYDCDFIIMGTNVRPGSDRLFLGPRIEHILTTATAPVLVYNVT